MKSAHATLHHKCRPHGSPMYRMWPTLAIKAPQREDIHGRRVARQRRLRGPHSYHGLCKNPSTHYFPSITPTFDISKAAFSWTRVEVMTPSHLIDLIYRWTGTENNVWVQPPFTPNWRLFLTLRQSDLVFYFLTVLSLIYCKSPRHTLYIFKVAFSTFGSTPTTLNRAERWRSKAQAT